MLFADRLGEVGRLLTVNEAGHPRTVSVGSESSGTAPGSWAAVAAIAGRRVAHHFGPGSALLRFADLPEWGLFGARQPLMPSRALCLSNFQFGRMAE